MGRGEFVIEAADEIERPIGADDEIKPLLLNEIKTGEEEMGSTDIVGKGAQTAAYIASLRGNRQFLEKLFLR